MITGGCACGALRYRAEGAPSMQGFCHCRSCQRIGGGGHMGFLCFPKAAVTIEGTPRVHTRIGDSGLPAARYACPTCLAVIYGSGEIVPDQLIVYAGSLDEPAQFTPTMAMFVSERPPWDDVSRNLQCFPQMPGAGPG